MLRKIKTLDMIPLKMPNEVGVLEYICSISLRLNEVEFRVLSNDIELRVSLKEAILRKTKSTKILMTNITKSK